MVDKASSEDQPFGGSVIEASEWLGQMSLECFSRLLKHGESQLVADR